MKSFNTIAFIVALLSVVILFRLWRSERAESARLESNQTALLMENLHYKTTQGRDAASAQALTLKCGEYEKLMSKDAAMISSLKLKIKNVESVAQTQSSTDIHISVPIVKTPTIGMDSARNLMRTFNWADPWAKVDGIIYPHTTIVYSKLIKLER